MASIDLNYIDDNELGWIECTDEDSELFVAYRIPRSQIKSHKKPPSAINNSGIYILFGKNEKGQKKVYIGQAQVRSDGKSFLDRLVEHDGLKKFWTEAIVFTKSTIERSKNFSNDQLTYLEYLTLQKAVQINKEKEVDDQYEFENQQFPDPESVIISDKQRKPCLTFFDSIKYVTYSLGHDLFIEQKREEATDIVIENRKYYGKLNISQIKDLCSECGYKYKGIWRRAAGNKNKGEYYSNPDIELLEKGWTLVLNDIDNEIIHVLQIPPKKFKPSDFKIKPDKNNYIDLHIKYDDPDFTDTRSGIKFVKYYFGQVDYSGTTPISTLGNKQKIEKDTKKDKQIIEKPTGFSLRGETFVVSGWSDLDRKLIRLLTSIDEVKMYQLATNNYCLPNGKSIHISVEKGKIKASRSVSCQNCSLGTIYFMTGMSNGEHMNMYKDLLTKFGIPFDELKIY